MANAVSYHLRGGLTWRLVPHDFPPWQTVYGYFRAWRLDGTWERAHAALREECRIDAGLPPRPRTGRLDSQTVKTTHRGGDRGWDGGGTRCPAASGSPSLTRSGWCGRCG